MENKSAQSSQDDMHWVHVKHDNCRSEEIVDGKTVKGFKGKSRMSIGPFSRKAAVAASAQIRMEHRTQHAFKSRQVVCIIKVEREPIDV